MDGVSWSATRSQESFDRSTTATTLSRLASLIARADPKQHAPSQRQPTYICGECGEAFSYPADLLEHQEVKHTLPKPHRCPCCGREFSLRSSLQLHRCSHDPERCHHLLLGSPCPACRSRSADPSRLQDKPHLRQPHLVDRSPYACAPCGRGFSQKQALLHHQQAGCSRSSSPSSLIHAACLLDDSPPASEGDLARSDSSDSPGPSRAGSMCPICSRSFRTAEALQRHRHNHGEEEREPREAGADEEARTVNGGAHGRARAKRKLLTCRSCDMVFNSTAKLYVHRREKHTREKNVKREQRPAVIKRRRAGTYPCQVCSKVFFHHLSLRAHVRRHTTTGHPPPLGHHTGNPEPAQSRPNTENVSQVDSKTVRAGPGRPRKEVSSVKDAGRGEEEEEEEEEEQEEEQEERDFPCPSCAEVFPLQGQLKQHMELHQSSVGGRRCSVCTQHMDSCRWPGSKRQRLYHCVPCRQGFSALEPFLQHCQEHLRLRVEEDGGSEGCTPPPKA